MLKLQVIGHLGRDAKVNTVGSKNVINFVVAQTEKFRDSQGNNVEKTTWVECSYWTNSAGIAPYLLKGQQVFVEGTPEVRTFEKNDGSTGVSLNLRVRDIQLLGGKGGANNATNQSQTRGKKNEADEPVEPIDDLPF